MAIWSRGKPVRAPASVGGNPEKVGFQVLSLRRCRLYTAVGKEFAEHDTVKHSAGEYVRGIVHTNTIEGFFAIFKRGMKLKFNDVVRRDCAFKTGASASPIGGLVNSLKPREKQANQANLALRSSLSLGFTMAKKQSSPAASSVAGKVLGGKRPTKKEALTLAASVLGQDEKKGQKKPGGK